MSEPPLAERAENAALEMESAADNEGFRWVLPNGQNCMILSPTGHLAVVHDDALRRWLATMKDLAAVLTKKNEAT